MKVGVKVRIKDGSPLDNRWRGFKAEVLEVRQSSLGTWLKPLSERPDGHGRAEFYWDTDDLEIIDDEEEKPMIDLETLHLRLHGFFGKDSADEFFEFADLERPKPKVKKYTVVLEYTDTTGDSEPFNEETFWDTWLTKEDTKVVSIEEIL